MNESLPASPRSEPKQDLDARTATGKLRDDEKRKLDEAAEAASANVIKQMLSNPGLAALQNPAAVLLIPFMGQIQSLRETVEAVREDVKEQSAKDQARLAAVEAEQDAIKAGRKIDHTAVKVAMTVVAGVLLFGHWAFGARLEFIRDHLSKEGIENIAMDVYYREEKKTQIQTAPLPRQP